MNAAGIGITSGIVTASVVGLASAAEESQRPGANDAVFGGIMGGVMMSGMGALVGGLLEFPRTGAALAGIGAGAAAGALVGSSLVKLFD